jgi:CRISPR-associated protein Cas6
VLRIKEKRVVGFPLRVTGLTAEESITLQEQGLGGRSKMGCGFFMPTRGH